MHDPMTVAFEIRYPWRAYKNPRNEWEKNYRASFITIWHVDPERDGTDDSCDWSGHKKKLTPKEKAIVQALWDLETLLDNRPHYPDSAEHLAFQPLKTAIYKLSHREGWRYPVRWHFWHWQFQIHPLQQFKRWAFSRCCKCGKRFTWGYSPCTNSWHSKGPRWFRGETDVYHGSCDHPDSSMLAGAVEETK